MSLTAPRETPINGADAVRNTARPNPRGRPVTKVIGESVADIVRQRQPVNSGSFPADLDLARPPADIVELQPGHLAATQPQPGQQQQDRVVTTTDRRRAIAAIQQ